MTSFSFSTQPFLHYFLFSLSHTLISMLRDTEFIIISKDKKERTEEGGGGAEVRMFWRGYRIAQRASCLGVITVLLSFSLSFLSLPLNQTSRSEIDTGRTPDESQCHRFPGLGIEKKKGRAKKQTRIFISFWTVSLNMVEIKLFILLNYLRCITLCGIDLLAQVNFQSAWLQCCRTVE